MARDIAVICVSEKQKYFLRKGWTGQKHRPSLICPSRLGKNVVFSKLMYDSVYDESRIQDRREP
jgi:hypothetical protein